MNTTRRVAVVGGGLAAAKATETLRGEGYDGQLVLVGAEPHLPYERPPLSKGFLMGQEELEKAFVHPRQWYDDHDVELHLGAPATTLDLEGHTVGVGLARLPFDRVLLATGSRLRRLPAADTAAAEGAPVTYLRTIEDSERIKAALAADRRIVVVGGGWIGLEVAAAARTAGCEVVVVEALQLPMVRVLGAEVAQLLSDVHRAHGVELRTGVGVAGVEAAERRAVVRLEDGTALTADLVVVGVGVAPGSELAEQAGLKVDNGVVVDERLRASHPDVLAAGDVANAFHPALGHHVRVEHWDNAIAQGRTAARNLLGAEEVYDRLPYFFSDQYDLGMEYVGHVGSEGYDELVLRGQPEAGTFTAFWVRDGRVLAAMHVNDWDATPPMRAIVTAGTVDLAALRDPRVALGDLDP
jgi:3-phenylpropionate/trans-cinnamate dioxygenase ferredoxin reductase component